MGAGIGWALQHVEPKGMEGKQHKRWYKLVINIENGESPKRKRKISYLMGCQDPLRNLEDKSEMTFLIACSRCSARAGVYDEPRHLAT